MLSSEELKLSELIKEYDANIKESELKVKECLTMIKSLKAERKSAQKLFELSKKRKNKTSFFNADAKANTPKAPYPKASTTGESKYEANKPSYQKSY